MRFWFILLNIVLLMGCSASISKKKIAEEIKAQPQKEQSSSFLLKEDRGSVNATLEDRENLEAEVLASDVGKEKEDVLPQEQVILEKKDTLNFELDLYETKELKLYFKYYTHSKRKIFKRWLERANQYLPFIRKVFQEQGLPEDLIFLPFAESGFNPWAYSRAGAAGLWQFMPYTAKKYGLRVDWWIDERRDPYKSTYAAAKMLKELYAEFKDWYLALAAYNAGPGKIRKALRKSKQDSFFDISKNRKYLRLETRHYVPKFLAILKIVRNLEELGFKPFNWEEQDTFKQVKLTPSTDLLALANYLGWSWNEFRKYNPFLRRMVSPPDEEVVIYVPQDKIKLAYEFLEQEKKRYAGFIRYKVKYGDSWWSIARRYGVPISVLKRINGHKSNIIRPKTIVLIPRNGREPSNYLASVRKRAVKRANYQVKPGDTLWDISRRFKVSVKTLKIANGLTSSKLSVGQKLYIPDLGSKKSLEARKEAESFHHKQLVRYQVRRGDNLWNIAKRFGVNWQELAAWNNLKPNSILRPGDTLKVYVP